MKQGVLALLKVVVFLFLLPLVIAAVGAFQFQILAMPARKEEWFLWGVVVFLLIYLFFYNFKEVQVFGQGIVSGIAKPLGPWAQHAGMVIPVYTLLLLGLYLLVGLFGFKGRSEEYLLLLLGFSIAMHIVLTAHQLYEADNQPIKAHYFLVFSLVLVASLFVISLLLGISIREFSFVEFLKSFSHRAGSHYSAIYKLLFVSPQ